MDANFLDITIYLCQSGEKGEHMPKDQKDSEDTSSAEDSAQEEKGATTYSSKNQIIKQHCT
mgnify:CR=1 FL=1